MQKMLINQKLDFVFGSRYQNDSGSQDDTLLTFIGNYFFTKLENYFLI